MKYRDFSCEGMVEGKVLSALFLKIEKKCPDSRNNNLIVSIYGLNISFEMPF